MPNRPIGVLWQKKSQGGTQYLSGTVSMGVFGECQVVVFKSLEKRGENSPDWIMYASTPQRQNSTSQAVSAAPEADEDIPF